MQRFAQNLGSVSAVIGAQWGDEGKGKVIDILAEHFDVIARASGGANAGHTIVVNGKKHVFHLLPAGSLHEGKPVVLGAAMVIHLPTLLDEIKTLEDAGVAILSRLHISPAAHIVFDYHKEIDAALEKRRAEERGQGIGTTRRGVGPAYMDKAARSGLRMESFQWNDDMLQKEISFRTKEVSSLYGIAVDAEKEWDHLKAAKNLLQKRIVGNTAELISEFLAAGKRILIEGAQATLLDIDHGTYPFVTSSNTTAAGALQGLGLPPRVLASCIGVAKAYCTRVGSGTFLTEADEVSQQRLRDRGGEYGATTGRPRRCGWLHIPDLKYAAMINGFDCWNITKLDVLDREDEIPIGIAVNPDGTVRYERLKGWNTSTAGITLWKNLPAQAQNFISFIEQMTGVPVKLIGTGQAREDMIVRPS